MKIWIDLTNSPHVNFFAHMITEFQRDHEVLLTSRPLANTIEMLDLYGFPHHVVGKHYGQNKLRKILGFMIRVWNLYLHLKDKDIDVAISHSSFYSPLVARLLGVQSIYLNDNEHASGNVISFLFADRILVPEFINVEKVKKQCVISKTITSYPGVKEGVYLWYNQQRNLTYSKSCALGQKKNIVVRPEPWTAEYYKGKRNFIDELLIELKGKFEILLLPRGRAQKEHYSQMKFSGVTVQNLSSNLMEIMMNCDLFIGAGGTMTREAAVLGIPTISIYQGELLEVDNYLIREGFMVHEKDLDAAFVVNFMNIVIPKPPEKNLLNMGKEAYELIKSTVLQTAAKGTENHLKVV